MIILVERLLRGSMNRIDACLVSPVQFDYRVSTKGGRFRRRNCRRVGAPAVRCGRT